MEVLLREVTGQSRGMRTYRDTVLSGQTLTLGSAPDQQIQLVGAGVQGNHAVLKRSGAGIAIQCRRGARVGVNGKVVRSARLGPGDVLEIAGHQLTLIEAPAGFDVALELLPNPKVDSRTYESAFTTDLDQTWLSRRGPSWLLLGLVLLTLIVPLAFVIVGGEHETPTPGAAAEDTLLAPPDTWWISGPLHPVHELAVGDDCSACHSELFHRVKDEDCRVCHDVLTDHVPAPRTAELELGHTRCATCHREHNEPEQLVITADGQCTDCHADPHQFAEPMEVAAVSGFAPNGVHPAFRARLLHPVARHAGTGLLFDWQYRTEPIASATETSNLVFPHDLHLDATQVTSPDTNRALGCSDCHTLTEDGEHFRPIDMETHCESCHVLRFDEDAPERTLPHGQPREAIFAIEGYYLKKFLDPADEAARPRRRLPGRSASSERCTAGPAECAARQTLAEVTNQFEVQGCVTCHTVTDTDATDLYSRFQVHPVRLVRDYFESGHFDHESHLTQEDKTGDAACLSCHPADRSSTSADLLIPDIDNCTACHGDPSVPNVVTLQCIDCHSFHPPAFRAFGNDPQITRYDVVDEGETSQ